MRESSPVSSPPPSPLPEPAGVAPCPPAAVASATWGHRTFEAFQHRNYRLFFLGQGVSLVGSWGRVAGLQWVVYGLTGSTRLLGTMSALMLLPIAVLAGPAGALADRVDRRRLMLVVLCAQGALSAGLAALVFFGQVREPALLALSLGFGVASAFEMPCRHALVVDLVGREAMRNAIALNSVLFNLALCFGPALAAVLMRVVSPAAPFVFDAVSYLAAIGAFALLRLPARVAVGDADGAPTGRLAGWRFVRDTPAVRTSMLLLAIAMVFGWGYGSLLAAYARDVLVAGELGYGALFASSGVGACVGALWVAGAAPGRDGRRTLACLVGFSVALAGLAASRTLVPALLARAAAGFCMVAFFALANVGVQARAPDALRGRVMGLWSLVFGATLPLGQFALGQTAARVGTPTTFAMGAAVCLLATGVVAATSRGAARRGRDARAA